MQPTSQPVQIDGFLSRYQTRSAKRKRVEVRAPTGQMSTTQVESGLSSGRPGKTPGPLRYAGDPETRGGFRAYLSDLSLFLFLPFVVSLFTELGQGEHVFHRSLVGGDCGPACSPGCVALRRWYASRAIRRLHSSQ